MTQLSKVHKRERCPQSAVHMHPRPTLYPGYAPRDIVLLPDQDRWAARAKAPCVSTAPSTHTDHTIRIADTKVGKVSTPQRTGRATTMTLSTTI